MLISPFGPFFMASRRASAPFVAYGAAVTLNPSDKSADITLSSGNLAASSSQSDANWDSVRATVGKSSGCWYWEARIAAAGNTAAFLIAGGGDASFTLTNLVGGSDRSIGMQGGGVAAFFVSGSGMSATVSSPAFAATDILNFALDMTRGELYIGKNGVYLNSGIPQLRSRPTITGITGTFYPAVSVSGAGGGSVGADLWTVNFGGSAFANSIPN